MTDEKHSNRLGASDLNVELTKSFTMLNLLLLKTTKQAILEFVVFFWRDDDGRFASRKFCNNQNQYQNKNFS